jgi:hypothetical protein
MIWRVGSFGLLLLGAGLLPLAGLQPQDNQAPGQDQGVEVLARGPVHEAYAEPVESRPQPTITVSKQPPDPIQEVPPDQKPEGDDVQWIPGYWSWDQDQQDFIWVSGFWRIPPPGRKWVPGYWQQVEEGWQWVPGFWASADQDQLNYLPAPPPSVDEGPSTPAPDENSFYVPGTWVYYESNYRWRPGYWMVNHPGWTWIPAHFCRSPYGYLFVEGFWDYPLHERGLLFCPVRFAVDLLRRAEFAFAPRYVVNADFLIGCLFVHPTNYHYYFGDYFGDRYSRLGFVPWIDYRVGKASFDPNFAYYRHIEGRDWLRGVQDLYAGRAEGRIERPPHTWVEQQKIINNITVNNTRNATVNKTLNVTNLQNVSVVTPLTQLANQPITHLLPRQEGREPNLVRLATVPRDQRTQIERHARQVHQFAQERRQTEARLITQGGAPVRHTDRPRTVRLPSAQATQEQPREERRPPIEQRPPAETRPPKEKRPPMETRPPAEKRPPAETRPPAEKRPPTETKPPVEKRPPTETRPRAEKRPPMETRPPTEQRPPVQRPPERRTPPPSPTLPRHEERPIPKYEPPAAPRPPRQVQPPQQRPESRPPAQPPR